MLIVKLQYGLGNQMFQYALGRLLSLEYNLELKLDVGFYKKTKVKHETFQLHKFNITTPTISLSKGQLKNFCLYDEGDYNSKTLKDIKRAFESFSEKKSNVFMDGDWQRNEYIEPILDLLRKDFELRDNLPDKVNILIDQIKSVNSVCLHVRRGDYVTSKTSNERIGFHGVEYIQAALPYITEQIKSPVFYIFSNDIKWCKENITLDYKTIYIDESHGWKNDLQYFEIMKSCKNFIIANSTYSWWAATLSTSKNKIVVTPKQWLKLNLRESIRPSDWIQVDYDWVDKSYNYTLFDKIKMRTPKLLKSIIKKFISLVGL